MRVYAWAALALAVLAASGWRFEERRRQARERAAWRPRITDTNNLRQFAGLVLRHGRVPVKDGVFVPYNFVRTRDIGEESFKLFRSERLDSGPTKDEILDDDYTNFPWERYRGDGQLSGARPFPILWEREPGRDGLTLVALSDGSVDLWDGEKRKAELAEAGVGR